MPSLSLTVTIVSSDNLTFLAKSYSLSGVRLAYPNGLEISPPCKKVLADWLYQVQMVIFMGVGKPR